MSKGRRGCRKRSDRNRRRAKTSPDVALQNLLNQIPTNIQTLEELEAWIESNPMIKNDADYWRKIYQTDPTLSEKMPTTELSARLLFQVRQNRIK